MQPQNDDSEGKGIWATVGFVLTIVFMLVYPVLEAKGLL